MGRGPQEDHDGASSLQRVKQHGRVALEEQTRGLWSQPGSLEVSECSGHRGCEMLQNHLTLRSSSRVRYKHPPHCAEQAPTAALAAGWEWVGGQGGWLGTHGASTSRRASAHQEFPSVGMGFSSITSSPPHLFISVNPINHVVCLDSL